MSYSGHIMRREKSIEKWIFQGTMEECSGRGLVTAKADDIKKRVGRSLAVA